MYISTLFLSSRMSEDTPLKPCNDHLDTGVILKNLHQLDELHLTFGYAYSIATCTYIHVHIALTCSTLLFFFSVQNCGMNFAWSLFEFTMVDCQLLAKALKATPTLKVLRLTQSKATDERGRLLVAHLRDHPSLHTLGKHRYK